MRPSVKFLSDELIQKITAEAIQVLCTMGVEIQNPVVLSLLADHGAKVDKEKRHVHFTETIIQKTLDTVSRSFKLYDVFGNETNDFSGDKVHITPGSGALGFLDYASNKIRKPISEDYIQYVKVNSQLKNIASQSTAFVCSDVHVRIADSYRLFLSLLYGHKPVVTGAFVIESFQIMKDFQVAIRGSEENLLKKPLTVFSCCPTSPLKWSDVTSQNLVDCAKVGIPIELISMPMAGFIAPVTLVGTLIQHTAETLSGVVISQLVRPGTPILYGGSPAVFDVRFETTPMGAIETMMIDCAYSEIGKSLGMPTQAYIGLSDAKQLDAQAGLETGIGITLAALSGINNLSSAGMHDFENCISLEKLVLDNEICGMVFRMLDGIEPKEDFPSVPHFQELLKEKHLLISKHTRQYLKEEHYFPGPVIDRMNLSRWNEEGSLTLRERAHNEVEKYLNSYQSTELSKEIKKDLISLMEKEAGKVGQDKLPVEFEL